MSRILVTGATGFIGKHLLARLPQTARHIRCLIRPIERRDFAAPDDVEIMLGDLTEPATLEKATDDIDVIFHLAGATAVMSPKWYFHVNTYGTQNLIDVCVRHDTPPVLIFVSSLAAAGPSIGDHPRTEDDIPQPASMYGRSKLQAERRLQAAADWLPATVVRPPSVLGPGDVHVAKMMKAMRSGWNMVPGFRNLRASWVYVDDLVTALIDASRIGQRLAPPYSGAERGRGVYFAGIDESPRLTELATMIAEVMQSRPPKTIYMPAALCWTAALFNDVRAKIENRALFLMPDKMRDMLAGSWVCSSEKAKCELGFRYTVGLREGFERIYRWYTEHGWL